MQSSGMFKRVLGVALAIGTIGLAFTAPAEAHKGGRGHRHRVIDLTTVTVTPRGAADAAITAAGGGQLLELRLDAKRRTKTQIKAEVLTSTGVTEVRLNPDGTVAKVEVDDDKGEHKGNKPLSELPPADVTWAKYAAATPVDSQIVRISMKHYTSNDKDVVRVDYVGSKATTGKAKGKCKRGKVLLNLDGTPLA